MTDIAEEMEPKVPVIESLEQTQLDINQETIETDITISNTDDKIKIEDENSVTPQPLLKKPKLSNTDPVTGPPPLPDGVTALSVISGSDVRRYINDQLTLSLLQGLKKCVMERPERPLRWLGEWLIARDKELNDH